MNPKNFVMNHVKIYDTLARNENIFASFNKPLDFL